MSVCLSIFAKNNVTGNVTRHVKSHVTSHIKIWFSALLLFTSLTSHAAWFTASGQAVVIAGDKEQARQQATQEAVKQALLFAGASVNSVQSISNGLLTQDQFEVRSSGEVSNVELIDEVYHNGIVTVSIRADIFAQKKQCSAADYTKRIASTYFPIRYVAQASHGQIHKLGKEVALKFQGLLNRQSANLHVSHIEPYVFDWHSGDTTEQVKFLANKTNTQYVMTVSIEDISVKKHAQSAFEFYKGAPYSRAFDFNMTSPLMQRLMWALNSFGKATTGKILLNRFKTAFMN